MIGNYCMCVTVTDNTLSVSYCDIENAMKQGSLVFLVGVTAEKVTMSPILTAERGEGEYSVTELGGAVFVTEDLDGFPVLSE